MDLILLLPFVRLFCSQRIDLTTSFNLGNITSLLKDTFEACNNSCSENFRYYSEDYFVCLHKCSPEVFVCPSQCGTNLTPACLTECSQSIQSSSSKEAHHERCIKRCPKEFTRWYFQYSCMMQCFRQDACPSDGREYVRQQCMAHFDEIIQTKSLASLPVESSEYCTKLSYVVCKDWLHENLTLVLVIFFLVYGVLVFGLLLLEICIRRFAEKEKQQRTTTTMTKTVTMTATQRAKISDGTNRSSQETPLQEMEQTDPGQETQPMCITSASEEGDGGGGTDEQRRTLVAEPEYENSTAGVNSAAPG